MAIWIARVVHESSNATAPRGVHQLTVLQCHEVKVAMTFRSVLFGALEECCLRQDFANVLDNKCVSDKEARRGKIDEDSRYPILPRQETYAGKSSLVFRPNPLPSARKISMGA
jgi:hypothetical protein